MSDLVRLSSAMPADDELNGLDALADQLNDEPGVLRVALITFDAGKIVYSVDNDVHIPYVRIRAFEPVGTVTDVPASLRKALASAREKRTGKVPLPIEAVTVPKPGDDDDPDVGNVVHLGRNDVTEDVMVFEGGEA